MRAGRENGAALPWRARGAACVRIRRCLPCGQKRCRAARRMWVCRGKKRFPQAHCPSGGFAGAPGKAKPFVPFSVEDTAHPPFSSAHERRKVRRPASPAAAFFPCLPAGRPAGSARTRPRDQSLGNPFLGDRPHLSPVSPSPKTPQAASPCSWACRRLPAPSPHAERNEAPMPPARGAWARRPRAEGAGRPHCGQGAEVMVSEMRFSMASMP